MDHMLAMEACCFQSITILGKAIYPTSGLYDSSGGERDRVLCDVVTANQYGEVIDVVDSRVRYRKRDETVQIIRQRELARSVSKYAEKILGR
jgi:hypothetical protein